MSPSTSVPTPDRGDAPRSNVVLVLGGVVLALAAAGAWFFLGRAPTEGPLTPQAPSATDGPRVLPATRMDPARTRLYATQGGMVLETVLTGTLAGDGFVARVRDTQRDPQRPWVFLNRSTEADERPVEAGRVDPKQVGRVALEASATGAPGETKVVVRLTSSVEAVTLVDLRASGAWEGFVVARSAPPEAPATPDAPK